MKKLLLYISVLLVFTGSSRGQDTDYPDASSLAIPPLNVLIDSAHKHSPLLKAKAKESDVKSQELKIEKKRWMDHVFIEGAANYGLFDQVIISGLSSDRNSSTGFLTKSQQARYYGGVGIKLPFSSATSRRNKLAIQRLTREKLQYEMLQMEQELQQIITDEYYRLKYLEESMKTFNNTYQTLYISYLKAEDDVENGRMKLADFSLLVSTMGKAKNDFLKATNDLFSQYFRLQNLTGMTFE